MLIELLKKLIVFQILQTLQPWDVTMRSGINSFKNNLVLSQIFEHKIIGKRAQLVQNELLTYREFVQTPNFVWKLVIIILKVSTRKPYIYLRYPQSKV